MHRLDRPIRAAVAAWLLGATLAAAQAPDVPTPVEVPAVAQAEAPAAPAFADPAALEAFLDGVVGAQMQNNGSPAGVVVIAHRGRTIFAKGYGYQDLETRTPVDPARTLFRPGSTSKLFTWVSVMQLVEQGKLDLDADVNTYLGDFRLREAFGAPVTLRHIMTHTAGFEDGSLGYLIVDDPARILPLAESMRRYQPERVNPPGTHTAYSNYATALAGLVVANVSGLSFNDYVRRNILEPLGMHNATFEEPLPAHLAGQMATSYALEAGAFARKPFEIISNFGPAGAMSAAGTDMLRFAQAMLNGGELDGQRILKPETVEQMLKRAFSHDERLDGMALGFYENDLEGTRVLGHGGDTQYFHTELGFDPANQLAFFVSFAADGGSAVRSSILPAFYKRYFPRQEAPPVAPADFAGRAARFAGNYGFWRHSFSKIEKVLGLASAVTVSATADNALVVGFGGHAKRYVEVGERLFRESDPGVSLVPGISPRLIAFQQDAAGDIDGFVMDGLPFMSLRKLPFWEAPAFNYVLLGVCFVLFLGVLARRFYQRAALRTQPAAVRSARAALVWVAAANWLVLIGAVVVIALFKDRLFTEIPLAFKAWLVLPIVAVVAAAWALFACARVWSGGLLGGVAERLRYSLVCAAGLAMCWFYAFWNILGFRYLE